ncbi:MAG TPA: thiamine diphosphokinase [Candidatus Limiplasma sp.]|nr:thiamine diphosphokinase [Candidatus Limiplasma sp.]HRX09424.1 thiamine diphosphokinase [Candidatus Limiplasma sp.]
MSVCYLIGAGSFTLRDLYPNAGDFVIAVDGGFSAAVASGITPDLLVGDFDSLAQIPGDIPVKAFPPEKDQTDMALALEEGMARGYCSFRFYGAGGGREDHTYANLQLLSSAARRGCTCQMVCPEYDVYALTNGSLRLPLQTAGKIVSVFSHGDKAEGVTLEGLKYPLKDATLTCDMPLGVSNETTGENPMITVQNGTLLIYVML